MCGGTEIAQFPQGAVYENSSIEQRKTLNAAEKDSRAGANPVSDGASGTVSEGVYEILRFQMFRI